MRRLRTIGISLAVIAAIVLVMAGSAGLIVKVEFDTGGPLAAGKIILVPQGVGGNAIAAIMAREGALENPRIFAWIARVTGADRTIRAGEYLIPAHASMRRILEILKSGRVVLHKLTIPEGLTSFQITQILNAMPDLSGTIASVPPEGSLLPQTYYYIHGENRNEILGRMAHAMTALLQTEWPFRAAGLPLQTPGQVVILASIVEKETGLADERAHIAGVYLNRLEDDMPLQADPTVAYGLSPGKPLDRPLTFKDLQQPTAYNTYLFKGLPPGPIANPGAQSIAAVLNPMKTKDLYFVADGTGGHSFSQTLKQQDRNVEKWRRIEHEQDRQSLRSERHPEPKIKPKPKSKPKHKKMSRLRHR